MSCFAKHLSNLPNVGVVFYSNCWSKHKTCEGLGGTTQKKIPSRKLIKWLQVKSAWQDCIAIARFRYAISINIYFKMIMLRQKLCLLPVKTNHPTACTCDRERCRGLHFHITLQSVSIKWWLTHVNCDTEPPENMWRNTTCCWFDG